MTPPSSIFGRLRGSAISLLPPRLADRVRGNEAAQRVGANIAWLGFDKLYSTAISFVVSVFVARYLGTSDFGLFSYTLAFVTIFQVPATLGLEEILVRELVRNPDDEGAILGTALGMRLISGFITMALIAAVVQFAKPDDANARHLVIVTSLLLIPQAFLVIQRLYIARVLAKYIVISGNAALTIVSVARLAMVHFHASLIWFVWTNVLLTGLTAIGLYAFYAAEKRTHIHWRYSKQWLIQLMRDAWPQIPSGIAGSVQNQIGALAIGSFLGNAELGSYAVAYRFYLLLLVAADIVCQSLVPTLTRAHTISTAHFERRLSQCYRLMFGIFLVALLPILFLGLGGIRLIYGRQYAGAGTLMLYFAIPLLLTYFGQLRMWYIVIENQLRYAMFISIAQASVSIISNYVLIRHFGAAGAVVAIALTALTVYVSDAIFKPGRRNTLAIIRALSVIPPLPDPEAQPNA
jgi:O-antigen/teichoic acid export membrane protein